MSPEDSYVGSELELFAKARRWKSYVCSKISPYVGDNVLEVGAGLGSMTRRLCQSHVENWVLLEPDLEMARNLARDVSDGKLPPPCKAFTGTIHDVSVTQRFDTILYLDVLEHIENDALELETAMKHLAPGGHVVVLAPAHEFLFSPFDAAIGHHRRYDRRSLEAAFPPGMRMVRNQYLDSVGVIASLANRLLLSRRHPATSQIIFWDRFMVPISRVIDPLTFHRLGKSILNVWTKS